MSKYLGQKIRNLRKEKKLSIEKLAEMSDSSSSYIWDLEKGIHSNPTAIKLSKISQALGVTMGYLTSDSEITDETLEESFFIKFRKLSVGNKDKIKKLVDMWLQDKMEVSLNNA